LQSPVTEENSVEKIIEIPMIIEKNVEIPIVEEKIII
jgi:hypothetical protein